MESQALQDAQANLLRLRERLGIKPSYHELPVANCEAPVQDNLERAQQQIEQRRLLEGIIADIPPRPTIVLTTIPIKVDVVVDVVVNDTLDTIRVYPDILTAILKHEREAEARIWLLLKMLDVQGSGRVDTQTAREHFTEGEKRICTWRHLRRLLAEGDGVFWQRVRDDSVILLYSHKTVAIALEVPRLTGRPIIVNRNDLTGGIAKVRANFYAAFHSGRRNDNPVSQETLRDITSVPERTQRRYNQIASVKIERNIAIDTPRPNIDNIRDEHCERGRQVYLFTDYNGLHGDIACEYMAYTLPNSYVGPHDTANNGQKFRINRALRLLYNGMGGNADIDQLFFDNGKRLGRHYNRTSNDQLFLKDLMSTSKPKSAQLWYGYRC